MKPIDSVNAGKHPMSSKSILVKPVVAAETLSSATPPPVYHPQPPVQPLQAKLHAAFDPLQQAKVLHQRMFSQHAGMIAPIFTQSAMPVSLQPKAISPKPQRSSQKPPGQIARSTPFSSRPAWSHPNQPVQSKTVPGLSVAQRMIALADVQANDYATMKVLHQLWQYSGSGNKIVALRNGVDFSKMRQGESLFIVGHGYSDSGNIKGVNTNDLIRWLTQGSGKIPTNIKEIVILTCYGGKEFNNTTLAQKIADELPNKNIKVYGATGYSYGTSSTRKTGFTSVLPTDYSVFYNGDDVEQMVGILKDSIAPRYYPNFEKQFLPGFNGVGTAIYQGERLGVRLNDSKLRQFAAEFIRLRGRLESQMKKRLRRSLVNGDVVATLNNLSRDRYFQKAVDKQYDLHRFLFASEDDAFISATRS